MLKEGDEAEGEVPAGQTPTEGEEVETMTPFEKAQAELRAVRLEIGTGEGVGGEDQAQSEGEVEQEGEQVRYRPSYAELPSAGGNGLYRHYVKKGTLLMQEGKYYPAVAAFENAAVFGESEGVTNLAKSLALFGAGEFMSSAFYLDKAIVAEPELARAAIDLAQLFGDAGVVEGQMAELDTWQARSKQPMLMFLQGYVHYRVGDEERARTLLEEARAEVPESGAIGAMMEALDGPAGEEGADPLEGKGDG